MGSIVLSQGSQGLLALLECAEDSHILLLLGPLLIGELGLVPLLTLLHAGGAGIHMIIIMVNQFAVQDIAGHGTDGGVLFILFALGLNNDGRELTEDNYAIFTAYKCTAKTIGRLHVRGKLAGAFDTIEDIVFIRLHLTVRLSCFSC